MILTSLVQICTSRPLAPGINGAPDRNRGKFVQKLVRPADSGARPANDGCSRRRAYPKKQGEKLCRSWATPEPVSVSTESADFVQCAATTQGQQFLFPGSPAFILCQIVFASHELEKSAKGQFNLLVMTGGVYPSVCVPGTQLGKEEARPLFLPLPQYPDGFIVMTPLAGDCVPAAAGVER